MHRWYWVKQNRIGSFEESKALAFQEGAQFPEIHELKDFWRFYKDQSNGKLGARPVAKTLLSRAKQFKAGFTRLTKAELSGEDTHEVNSWIKNVLPFEEGSGVKNIERAKFNYKPVDLDRNLKSLWTREDLKFTHERSRFQVHFLLLLFCQTGARRGGLLTGIKYKDIRLVLQRNAKGDRQFIFKLDQRKVKGNKDPDNKSFGAVGREHPMLRYNAIWFLLLFAIADRALHHGLFIQILQGDGDGPIEWNEDVQDHYICQLVDRQGTLDPTKPMSPSLFDQTMRQLFMSEYDQARVSMHMVRRELGKQLDERYTETERSQHLLQADKNVFGQSYVAFVSSCDGFAAFMREKPDHTAVEYFQGISQFWQPGLPTRILAEHRAQVKRNAEIMEYNRKLQDATDEFTIDRLSKDRQNAIKRLEKLALNEYRSKRMKEMRQDRLLHGFKSTALNDDMNPLYDVMPELGRTAGAMANDSPLSQKEELEIMQSMLSLLTNPWTVFYPPEEMPNNGACPYCNEKVDW
ncbi:hypothetical protein S40288_10234 [Stachybotrys chartarum IBT 40288]|nr:hypothetical protein S40288_10234 [Stachybotrys chartarum IBT 40288]